MSESHVRAFIAVKPPEAVLARLATLETDLHQSTWPGGFRWTPLENVHLTLLFLGNVLRSDLNGLQAALESACEAVPAFEVECRGLGCFPNSRRPSVLWAGLKGNLAGLAELQRRIVSACSSFGEHQEKKAFRPHLTLARAKRFDARLIVDLEKDLAQRSDTSFGTWTTDHVSLVESRLRTTGPEYHDLQTCALIVR
jgi:RNA 2',3'-cyclic 3'-phosphodiesterase